MANNDLPIVLNDGKQVPLDPTSEYMNIPISYDVASFGGDGSEKNPISLNLMDIHPQYNRFQQKPDGLFATEVNYQQMDVICDFTTAQSYLNGYLYMTGKVDYSHLVDPAKGELVINTWSWTGQSTFYNVDPTGNYPRVIPYTLAAVNWQPTAHTLEFHFILFQHPASYKHYLPTQTLTSGKRLYYSVYFNYYYK